jgi:hypothetical protein
LGRSLNKELYFRKEIQNKPTAQSYLEALNNSPYKTHKRMAVALAQQGEFILQQAAEHFKESHESSDERTKGIPDSRTESNN